MSINKNASLVGTIESLLQKVGAEAHTEPGGYKGPTTHVTKNVDDQTQEAVEGFRSAENAADVKKTIPNSVDSTTSLPSQSSAQMSIGLTSDETGEKVPDAKGGKEDSKTSHPARTDNNSLEGGKYASDSDHLRAICKQVEKIGSDLCATIAVSAAPAPAGKQAASMPVPEGEEEEEDPNKLASAQAGYDLAGVFAGLDVDTNDKLAADAMVLDTLQFIIETAERRATKCAEFYEGYFKSAEGEMIPPEAMGGGGAPPPGAGGMPPEAGGAPPGGGGDEQALLQMLAGGGGGGGGGAPPGGGGEGGLPPEVGGGEGELPPEAGGGEGELPPEAGGGMSPDDQQLQMLEQILQELQAKPEQVEQAAKAAMAKRASQTSPRPNDKVAHAAKYAKMKGVIQELLARSA